MRYYIATRLENHQRHNMVRDLLASRGHRITYDWTTHGTAWPRGMAYVQEVIQQERAGVLAADFVVVLLEGGRGTHVEMGIALGANKPVLLVESPDSTDPLGFLRADGPFCGFYVSYGVSHHKTINEMMASVEMLEAQRG